MTDTMHILLIEDSRTYARLIESCLKTSTLQCRFDWAESLDAAGPYLSGGVDVALVDLNLPDSYGIDTVRRVQEVQPGLPVIVLSGHEDDEVALQALREGAQDYIPKSDFSATALTRSIRFAVERHERKQLEDELRSHRLESDAAQLVQQSLMATELPTVAGWELAGRCRSADAVGGDFFDFVPWPDNRLGFVVGDVSGHGMSSALLMASTHRVIRTLKDFVPDPAELLSAANEQICDATQYRHFVTLFLAVVDLESHCAQFVSAGHEAILLRNSGETVRLAATALPTGMTNDLGHEASDELSIEPGDVLVGYTDGLVESHDSDRNLLGDDIVLSALIQHRHDPLDELIDRLINMACRHCAPKEPHDDITIAMMRRVQP